MKKLILLILLTYVGNRECFAQNVNGKITVKVIDGKGQPLPFASVVLRQSKDSTLVKGELSAADGSASFEKINTGHYFIQSSLVGYQTAYTPAFSIDPQHTAIQFANMTLSSSSKNLQGVTVTAQKPFIERKEGATVLNVESSVAAAGSTVLDVLRRAPGVQIDKDDNILLKGNGGVTVMLDGKLTYLSGEQLANLLKSLPAETVSQIEIMTSPSAKYDAAGNSGIINIKTKKGVATGINGSVNGSGGFGRYGFWNTGLNLNWRTEKFNAFGNYNHGDRHFYNQRLATRVVNGDNKEEAQYFSAPQFGKRNFISNGYKLGFDYFITPKHTVGVLLNGNNNFFRSNIFNTTNIYQLGHSSLDSALYSVTNNDHNFNTNTINVNYKGQLDTLGTEVSIDADYAKFGYHRRVYLNDSMYYPEDPLNKNPHAIRNFTTTNITIKSIKGDLVLPFNKTTRLETGVKGSFVTTDNVLLYDSLYGGKYIPALSQSNHFIYTENVLAAYGLIKKSFKNGTDAQLGLRVEGTSSAGNSVTYNSVVKRRYVSFFPNFSADHTFSKDHKLGVTYARRINRPEYEDLNPFIFYSDRYTYGRGNPYLQPEFTNIVELTYSFKQKYILSLSYDRTENFISEFLEQNDSTKVTTSYDKNYDYRQGWHVSLTVPVNPTKWWSINNNLNMNYNYYALKDSGMNIVNSAVGAHFETTSTFTLPGDWKIEVNAYGGTPFQWGVWRGKAYYAIGGGVQKTLFDKKLNMKLNFTDVTNGDQFRGAAVYGNVDFHIHNQWQNRTATLSATYSFGNSKIKGARERQTATSAEAKRSGG
ncbi:outer membrane beta-barrel family protein [[Flexibacter] sp. ATCC 35208]|uniref:outer membrane beta-barrel family protein n=1 Tax=[Flexibacter] sp. ATCC 35208 TaxID=1936242 RepID=UPI0009C8CB6B|nr:outer membrane beta-barrel family protein [[Flexibacter] sp. ATCC 35208]OMP76118.1 hypothetical protein BW716_26755 [[Flexibacter] sp. ATCC 35208]